VAVEPRTSASFFLFLPRLDGACFDIFLQAFRQAFPDEPVTLVLDKSGSHRSGDVTWPEGITALPLPPYSPELNPAERLFKELRAGLANEVCASLEALEETLSAALPPY
jgi:transposase